MIYEWKFNHSATSYALNKFNLTCTEQQNNVIKHLLSPADFLFYVI